MKRIIFFTLLVVLTMSGNVLASSPSLYLTLTSQEGTSTIVVIDERGTAKIAQLDSGTYSVSLSATSKKFSSKRFPKTLLIEWLSIDDPQVRTHLLENESVAFSYDAEGVIQSKPITKRFWCKKKGDYSILLRVQMPAAYNKK